MRYVMVLAVSIGCGCGASESNPDLAEMEEVWRSGGGASIPGYLGDGDIAVYEGASTASEDCLIYTTIGTQVNAGRAPVGPTIMTVTETTINDPSGAVLCTRESGYGADRIRLGGPSGPVLFTAVGRWIFDGEIMFQGKTWPEIVTQFDSQLLYTFKLANIYEHSPYDGEILATATTPIAQASPMRKLVLAALIAGECGGLGLYAEEDDDPHAP